MESVPAPRDVRAHGVEEVGQIHDVGLLGGVFDGGDARRPATAAIMMFMVAPTETTSR